ncbi:hypothetical protein AAFG07_18850 [Bradyrhizobium sp. B097]
MPRVSVARGFIAYNRRASAIAFKKALGKPPAKYLSDIVQGGGSAFAA